MFRVDFGILPSKIQKKSNEINSAMKTFQIIGLIFMVICAVAVFYGMNKLNRHDRDKRAKIQNGCSDAKDCN